jgi:hypothetical protein
MVSFLTPQPTELHRVQWKAGGVGCTAGCIEIEVYKRYRPVETGVCFIRNIGHKAVQWLPQSRTTVKKL